MSRRFLSVLFAVSVCALLWGASASADTIRITGNSDHWLTFTEPQVFTARTYSVDGAWSDPHLWLYNESNELVAANDDWFGLQSFIQVQVQPGVYRLRAGVCCGDPNRWYDGVQYDLETSVAPVVSTTLTESTPPTTLQEPSTTSEPSTTTTSSTSSSTSTSSSSTTTTTEPPPTTTTLLLQSTTLPVVPETSIPATTTTEVVSTTTSSSSTTTSSSTVPVETTSTTTTSTTTSSTTTTSTTTTSTTTTVPVTTTTVVPPVLEAISKVDELTEEQITVLVEQLNTAPDEVKEEFEAQVNVFDGRFDSYVPAGSTIPVSQRRVLIAVSATLLAAPAVSRRK